MLGEDVTATQRLYSVFHGRPISDIEYSSTSSKRAIKSPSKLFDCYDNNSTFIMYNNSTFIMYSMS
jgi:hypothetical protein